MNKVIMVGNLVNNPSHCILETGVKISKFRLAVDNGKKSTVFINVTVFDKLAELVMDFLQKGSKVLIDGRLEYRQIEKDGVYKEYYDIVANNVQFLQRLKEKNNTEVVETKQVIDKCNQVDFNYLTESPE